MHCWQPKTVFLLLSAYQRLDSKILIYLYNFFPDINNSYAFKIACSTFFYFQFYHTVYKLGKSW